MREKIEELEDVVDELLERLDFFGAAENMKVEREIKELTGYVEGNAAPLRRGCSEHNAQGNLGYH